VRSRIAGLTSIVLLVGCASSTPAPTGPSAEPTPQLTPAPPASPTATATPTATPGRTEPSEPPRLIGTWRTTLAGQPLSLNLTDTSYRIVRGGNVGEGSVRISGDEIEFFDSSLCRGTGAYRWSITDGVLSLVPTATEPCPGRAEALLVPYSEYTPPRGD
jgi:hypothetical protein